MRASLWIVLMLASAVRIAAWSRVRPRLQLFLCSSASSSSSSSSPPRSPGSPLQAMCDSLSKIKNIAGATSSPLQNAHIEACMQAMSQVTLQDVGLSTPVLTDMQCFYIQETPTFHVAVFILPKGKALSLHDHPGMAVCSRLLRGSLRVRAYTPTETPVTPTNTDGTFEVDLEYEGVKTPSDGAWVISPSRGNIHELRAEEDCVILDVLLPPYKEPDRPCNFYVQRTVPVPLFLRGTMTFGRGIADDFKRRAPYYLSDWADGLHLKVLSSTFFIFFTSMAPAITFSLLLSRETDGQVGAIEVLMSTAITGVLFSLFAGQPLVIVGVTGPVSILTVAIYALSQQWGIHFLPLYAWSQIWGAAMLVALAGFNACDGLKYITRFSCEIFGILIALLYLYTGAEGIIKVIGNLQIEFASGLLQLIIALGTVFLATLLSHARGWNILNEAAREVISDYGATLSIVLWSTVPLMTNWRLEEDLPTLFVPLKFETTTGRPWLVDLGDIPPWGVFAAIFPGFIIMVLFIFDHNVSSLLAQEHELRLKKGSAFHLDFLVLGIGVLLTGLMGLPPTNGLIPQAPLHTKSLTVRRRVFVDEVPTDVFEVDHVRDAHV
ncbi:HCO3 transporter family-domain-containing protein [Ochromonadaceae sp. CCMP2298]|nr:HCO3 transporter family-domain-containing protein [Ochromonadaceae sp. CCMP2298]